MSLPLLGIRFSFFLQQGGFLASMKNRPLFTDILNSQTILQRGVLCGNNYYFISAAKTANKTTPKGPGYSNTHFALL